VSFDWLRSFTPAGVCFLGGLGGFVGCGGSQPSPEAGARIVVFTPAESAGAGSLTAKSQAGLVASSDAGPVTQIATAPLALVPAFSPDVQDYYVQCAAGSNSLTVDVTDTAGTTTDTLDLDEDQAVVVNGAYWIRCLPHDFPQISVAHPSGGAPTPGYYLVNNTAYAMVLDTRATPVWYARGSTVANIDSLQPNTLSVLPNGTAPYGTNPAASFQIHALGDQTTTVVQAVGSPTDSHELRLLPNGDYLLFTYTNESNVDLTGLKTFGAGATIADCAIQEVNPAGAVVWTWRAIDHVDPVTESLEPTANTIAGVSAVDVFHCNSIDVDATGNLLVSMRHTNSLFYIDRGSGQVLWKLGGTPVNKDGAACIQVVDDPEGTFSMQHDARFLPNGDISLFDDHGASPGVARGVEYAINAEEGTASVVFQFLGTTVSQYEGSFRREADGESVVGWGGDMPDPRVITELDGDGNDVFDVSFAPAAAPYRAVKVPITTLDIGLLRMTAARW
jgi:hypothetical protein